MLMWPGTQVIIISILLFSLLPNVIEMLGFSGDLFSQGQVWRIFTYPFAHFDTSHLFENIAALSMVSLLAYEVELSRNQFITAFFGASILLGLTSLFFTPTFVIAGASIGIFSVIGTISIKGSEFLSRWIIIPVMFSSLFIHHILKIFSASFFQEGNVFIQTLFHTLGFIYGLTIFLSVMIYKRKTKTKILTVN